MSVGTEPTKPRRTQWQEFLGSDLVATRETLVPYGMYALFTEGVDGSVPWDTSRIHVKVYSCVHVQDGDIPSLTRGELEIANGELVVCVARQDGATRRPEPRIEPALRYGLAEPDEVSHRMKRIRVYACVPTSKVRGVRDRFTPYVEPPSGQAKLAA